MGITVRRSRGFAGVNEVLGPVDTDDLDDDLGHRVKRKVEEIRFFDFPETLPEDRSIEDGFFYEVTVVDGDRRHIVAYSDGTEERSGSRWTSSSGFSRSPAPSSRSRVAKKRRRDSGARASWREDAHLTG